MKEDSRLTSLLRARESGEKDALRLWQEVERIVAERRGIVDELRAKCASLTEKLRQSLDWRRISAMQQGDLNQLSALTGYGKRLSRELEHVEEELESRVVDLARALERAGIAERDFSEAHVERKRVEQLIEGQRQSKRVLAIAREELLQDEMQGTKKGK